VWWAGSQCAYLLEQRPGDSRACPHMEEPCVSSRARISWRWCECKLALRGHTGELQRYCCLYRMHTGAPLAVAAQLGGEAVRCVGPVELLARDGQRASQLLERALAHAGVRLL
jgi:hypothetical protein